MQVSLYVMAIIYIAIGIYHFVNPRFFENIIPPFVPNPKFINWIAGAAEILLGFGLLIETLRSYAAIGIILLLIAVFPANIYMALSSKFGKIPAWVRWGRLPLQFVLIWWAWLFI